MFLNQLLLLNTSNYISKMRKAHTQQDILLDMCLWTTFVDKFYKSFCFRKDLATAHKKDPFTFYCKKLVSLQLQVIHFAWCSIMWSGLWPNNKMSSEGMWGRIYYICQKFLCCLNALHCDMWGQAILLRPIKKNCNKLCWCSLSFFL